MASPALAEDHWTGGYTSANDYSWTYNLDVDGDRVTVRGFGDLGGKRRPVVCDAGHVFKDEYQTTCITYQEDGKTRVARAGLKVKLTGDRTTMSYKDDVGASRSFALRKIAPAAQPPVAPPSVVAQATPPAPAPRPAAAPSAPSAPQHHERWTGGYTDKAKLIWTYILEVTGDRVTINARGQIASLVRAAECKPGTLYPNQTVQLSCAFANDGGSPGLRFTLSGSLTDDTTKLFLKDETGETSLVAMRKDGTVAPSPRSAPPASQAAAAPPAPLPPVPRPAVVPVVTANEANKFIVDGNPADVVVVLSAHAEAPHVSINLRGDATFKSNTADACFLGADPLPVDVEIELDEGLAKKGASIVKRQASTCDPSRPDAWDLAVGRRADFLALQKPAWERLDKALLDAKAKALLTISDAEVKIDREARTIAGLTNETRIVSDGINGWGFVFPESAASVVCTITKGPATVFEQLVASQAKPLQKDLGRQTGFKVTMLDADTAFMAAKSKDKSCGAIFATQPDLKAIVTGFRRDKVAYKVSSVWLTSETIESALAAAEGQKAAETQAQADARRKAEAERELRRQKDESEGVRIREATQELRRQNGAKVAGLTADLKTGLGAILQAQQSGWYGRLYPQFVNWMQERRSEGWEPVSHDVDVLEFGDATWNNRTLELILVRAQGVLKNRAAGTYLQFCFDHAYLPDPEFEMRREPFFGVCGASPTTVPAYLKGMAFRSKWNAQ